MRFDERDVRFARGRLDDDRLEFRLGARGFELFFEIVLVDAQAVFNQPEVLFVLLEVVAQQKNAERG